EYRLRNHGAAKIGTVGQGLAQEGDKLTAIVRREGIGFGRDRLLFFAKAAAGGQRAGCQQQHGTCALHSRDRYTFRSRASHALSAGSSTALPVNARSRL